MRKLAIFACSCSAAVFLAVFLLPEGVLVPAGGLLGGACLLFSLLRGRTGRRAALALALVCAGAAVGLLWTRGYLQLVFRPAQAMDGRTLVLTATVEDWPQETEYGYTLVVRADTQSWVKVRAILYTDSQGAQVRPGDRVTTVAHCTLGDRTFAGEEITYYTAKGIFFRAQAYGELAVERPEHPSPRYFSAYCADAIRRGIQAAFPADAAPLVRALVTGNRENLTDAFTTSLQRVGLSHTVAVSGMHLAFLAGLLSLVLGRGKRRTALVTLVWVVVFCGVAGNTPSVLRAAVMILMLQLAPLVERERDILTSLAFALMMLLLSNPFSAAHVGLQLSFGAVAGILLVSDPIQSWLLARLRLDRRPKAFLPRQLIRLPRFLVSTLAATLGASVLTVPLVALHFRIFSLISPVSNLLTLWAVALLFLGGFFLGILGAFLPAAAAGLAQPFTALARYLDWVVDGLGRMPFAAVPLDSLYYRAWIIFFALVVGITLTMRKRGRQLITPVCALLVTLACSMLLTAGELRRGSLGVTVLDVGQGQSVLVSMDGFLALVDCGGDSQDDPGDIAADLVQSMGRGRLDLLVVSHCHADHANGVLQLLERLEVGGVALPDVEEDSAQRREILAACEERDIPLWLVGSDTYVDLGEGRTITLFAPLGQGTGTNELGLTVLASAGEEDVLITGDMPGEVEQELLAHARLPQVEVLVAGHHGAESSTTGQLLEAIAPEVAVISAGLGNSYGHPHSQTLERLARAGAEIYRTDLQGTVSVRLGDGS